LQILVVMQAGEDPGGDAELEEFAMQVHEVPRNTALPLPKGIGPEQHADVTHHAPQDSHCTCPFELIQ
jgi:hypothetical protein